ncbi:hypothetical protein MCOR25_009131 [Pyricularia grisea]|nr:hypothetical protein MCOR25_009131 [Pyricularia grisea]
MSSETQSGATEASSTNEAGCHCGYIKFSVTLSPPLSETKVLDCGCSICRRAGYLLVYPKRHQLKWHGDSQSRCAVYQFNTKKKDQLFCPKCGSSIGIDFRDVRDGYGISVRTFNNINLADLKYHIGDGLNEVEPATDLSGIWYEEDADELKDGKEKA